MSTNFILISTLRAHVHALCTHQHALPPRRCSRMRGRQLPGVRHVIAVASGKGGVGKSTVSVNLATALAMRQLRVGLLDADLFGPSLPLMMNLRGEAARPVLTATKQILPVRSYGVACMSIGLLLDANSRSSVVWRGLMVTKAIEQLLHQVQWGPLDCLVIDMPPGTGDTQLTVTQQASLTGALIVTTPQQVALSDARRAADMFARVNVPILGVVQNMSRFECPHCHHSSAIFAPASAASGAEQLAAASDTTVLADIPIDPVICETSDTGQPIVLSQPQHPCALAFQSLADKMTRLLTQDSK